MPKVGLDIEEEKLDKKKEEFLDLLQSFIDRRLAELLARIAWHLNLLFNGGARILRAISSWIEFHLSSSYVLFNLKALSVVTGGLLFVENGCSPGLSLQVVNHGTQ
jgi:hypothetical protein